MPETRVERQIVFGAVLAIGLFAATAALALHQMRELVRFSYWVSHTQDVLLQLGDIAVAVTDAEAVRLRDALDRDAAAREEEADGGARRAGDGDSAAPTESAASETAPPQTASSDTARPDAARPDAAQPAAAQPDSRSANSALIAGQDPRARSAARIAGAVARLSAMTLDNAEQQRRILLLRTRLDLLTRILQSAPGEASDSRAPASISTDATTSPAAATATGAAATAAAAGAATAGAAAPGIAPPAADPWFTAKVAVLTSLRELRTEEERLLASRAARSAVSTRRVIVMLTVLAALGVLFLAAAFVLTRRHRRARAAAERALASNERRLRLILDNMIAGLIVLEPNGRIESINRAGERMFGHPAAELIGRTARRLLDLPSDEPEAAGRFIASIADSGLNRVTEWNGRRADGRTFPMELSLFEFASDTGRRFVAVVRDISERRAAERMKQEFIVIASHELRTPLTSLRGGLQLVLDSPATTLDPDDRVMLGIALTNCEQLIRIVNDLLEVSRIEAGQVTLARQPCGVRELAHAALPRVAELARRADVEIDVDLSVALRPIVGDFDRLVQMLVSLLINAVTNSPRGARVTLAARDAEGGVRIAVTDRGSSAAAAAAAGERDLLSGNVSAKVSANVSASGHANGLLAGGADTGLGLAFVCVLVERHHGRITFENQPGAGSTFVVTLPAA